MKSSQAVFCEAALYVVGCIFIYYSICALLLTEVLRAGRLTLRADFKAVMLSGCRYSSMVFMLGVFMLGELMRVYRRSVRREIFVTYVICLWQRSS